MPKILIDGDLSPVKIDEGISLGALVHIITQHLATLYKVMTNIKLDGTEFFPEDTESQSLSQPFTHYSEISFVTKATLVLAIEALNDSPLYIENLLNTIAEFSVNLRRENYKEAYEKLSALCEQLALFIQLLNNAFFILEKKGIQNLIRNSFQQWENRFLQILKKVLASKERGDGTMLTDLLEYELAAHLQLCPSLIQTQLKGIP